MVAEAAKTAKPGRVDRRPRLAPGEVDVAPDAERRRLSDARVARRGVAEQPGRADARQRPRQLRQRARRWSCRASPGTTPNPAGGEILKDATGDPTGLLRETASRPDPRRRRPADAGRARGARAQGPRARRPGSAVEGHHTFQDAGSSFATIDLMKTDGRRGAARRAAVGDGARGQRGAKRRSWRSTG